MHPREPLHLRTQAPSILGPKTTGVQGLGGASLTQSPRACHLPGAELGVGVFLKSSRPRAPAVGAQKRPAAGACCPEAWLGGAHGCSHWPTVPLLPPSRCLLASVLCSLLPRPAVAPSWAGGLERQRKPNREAPGFGIRLIWI